jgi:hypothetical protein
MVTDRQIEELVARCVATLVYYQNLPQNRHALILLKAELRATASGVAELGLGAPQVAQRLLRPVEAELVSRYGPEHGGLLAAEFVRAFGGTAGPVPILAPLPIR